MVSDSESDKDRKVSSASHAETYDTVDSLSSLNSNSLVYDTIGSTQVRSGDQWSMVTNVSGLSFYNLTNDRVWILESGSVVGHLDKIKEAT